MTHKRIKFANDCESSQNVPRHKTSNKLSMKTKCRPVIASKDDEEQMAIESSRAKLVNQILGKSKMSPREFSSYFHGIKNTSAPSYLVTSHSKAVPRKELVYKTYPSVQPTQQNLRWNPNIDTTSIDDYKISTDTTIADADDSKYECTCENCTTKKCPIKILPSSFIKPGAFKDNIMTFADGFTMTPKLNEAGCGSCVPIPSAPRTSDMSMLTTRVEFTLQDSSTSYDADADYVDEKPKRSAILKKKDYDSLNNRGQNSRPLVTSMKHEAVRDTDHLDDYLEPERNWSNNSNYRRKDRTIDNVSEISNHTLYKMNKKTLYNEGINDEMFPSSPVRVTSPTRLLMDCGVGSDTRRYGFRCKQFEAPIPYCHRNDSKYHQHCGKAIHTRVCSDSDEEMHYPTFTNPNVPRCNYHRYTRPAKGPKTIIYPKRVLTSIKNINYFGNTNDLMRNYQN